MLITVPQCGHEVDKVMLELEKLGGKDLLQSFEMLENDKTQGLDKPFLSLQICFIHIFIHFIHCDE